MEPHLIVFGDITIDSAAGLTSTMILARMEFYRENLLETSMTKDSVYWNLCLYSPCGIMHV